jgi:cysteinyl-tRNA synthetase
VLTDTRTREGRTFEPVTPGIATVYVCGPALHAPPHLGDARSAVVFDVLRRWLTERGYAVTYVRGLDDVDAALAHDAGHEGISTWALAERNRRAHDAAYAALGVLPPTVEPLASAHVPELVALTQTLIDKGHAYASGGDVYFDVGSYPSYGELSGQRPDRLMQTEKTDPARPRRSPLDFALWHADRPAAHLGCAAMSAKYLGQPYDVHVGGIDLLFPHHEDEHAYGACAGDGPAGHWLHHGHVGNAVPVADVLAGGVRHVVLRYFLAAAHYRADVEHSEAALAEAAASYARVETFVRNAGDLAGDAGVLDRDAWDAFAAAMDDDLAVPRALAVVHGVVGRGNTALAERDVQAAGDCRATAVRMLRVLGLDPLDRQADGDPHETLDALVRIALDARIAARARKDFAEADAIRDRLAAAGVVVEDTAEGVRWHLRSA